MSSAGRRNATYVAARKRFQQGNYTCHICGQRRGTTPDHHPPLHLFAHYTLWQGTYLPACIECQHRQGGLIRDAQRARSHGVHAYASRQW